MKKHLLTGFSLLSFGVALLTAQTAQTTFLTQNFQGTGIPAGWTQSTQATDGGWKFGINTALQSQYFQIPAHTKFACTNDDACNCDKSADRLIADTIDLSAASAAVVKFDYFNLAYGNEVGTVEVSVDLGITWVVVDTVPQPSNGWAVHITDISAVAAGHAAVLVSFKYNDAGQYADGLAIDNVTIYQPVAADAKLSSITPTAYTSSSYNTVNNTITLGGSVTNYGATAITSCPVRWSDGTNTYTYTLSSTIPVAGSVNFTHSQPYTVPSTGLHPITMWVDLASDTIHNNDTLSTTLTGAAFIPAHKLTIEDQTICSSTNGYYSARGIVWKDSFARSNLSSGAEIISVHAADPMANTVYANGAAAFLAGNLAWPQVQADRKSFADPIYIFDQYNKYKDDFGVADIAVSLNYDSATRALNVSADAHFAVDVTVPTGSFNLALVLTEDSVHKDDTTYSQRNAYSGGGNGPLAGAGIDFTAQPPYVPGSLMYYMNVARYISGSYTGINGSLPGTIVNGSTESYLFPAYTVPDTFNAAKMRAIVLLINTTTGQIANANGAWLVPSLHTGINEPVADNSALLQVFPNPFTGQTNLRFKLNQPENVSLRITNLLGETVSAFENRLMPSGEQTLTFDGSNLASGVYLVNLKAGNTTLTKRVAITK